MGLLIKLRKFLSLDINMMFYMIEAFFYLGWARLLLFRRFIKIAPSLGRPMQETSKNEINNYKDILIGISDAVHIMSRHTFWKSQCFVKAIAAMKMLERRKIESTLYLGTARDQDGKMIAHAWLRSGIFIVAGKEGMDRFTVVNSFAKTVE